MKTALVITASMLALALGAGVFAQHEHHAASPKDQSTSTLSAEAIEQLLAGDGMGLARPAELNGYPGPKHVLELKAALKITREQEEKVEQIRQRMLDAARPLGRSIVDAERALDAAFKAGTISDADLTDRTTAIAKLQGELRRVHLHAHLLTKPVLTAQQLEHYHSLRQAHH